MSCLMWLGFHYDWLKISFYLLKCSHKSCIARQKYLSLQFISLSLSSSYHILKPPKNKKTIPHPYYFGHINENVFHISHLIISFDIFPNLVLIFIFFSKDFFSKITLYSALKKYQPFLKESTETDKLVFNKEVAKFFMRHTEKRHCQNEI